MTLIQYIVDRYAGQVVESGTGANLIYIACSLGSTATGLKNQLGCVQQGLGIAVDALVVVVVQVLRRRTVLIVGALRTILAVLDVSILIALCIGIATYIPASHVATLVVLGIHIVGLQSHGQESPTVVTAVPAFATSPTVR